MGEEQRRFGRPRREHAGEWSEPESVSLADAAVGAELAREAASPFGCKRPAHELLARFGGDDDPEARRRATAALRLAGIVADPPLTDVTRHQLVHLRVVGAAAAPDAAPDAEREEAAPGPERPSLGELLRAGYRIRRDPAAADRPPVPTDRRIRAGALGLGALALLMVAVVLLRGAMGGDDETAGALPAGDAPAVVQTTTASTTPTRTTAAAPARTTPAAPARAAPVAPLPARPARPARPRTVRLRIVPTAEAYVCVADGNGATIYEGMLSTPYVVRRRKLILRVGTAGSRIDANGRAIRVTRAPGAFELTPTGTRELPGDALVCGAG